jgi:hypothetical protein
MTTIIALWMSALTTTAMAISPAYAGEVVEIER